MGIKQKKFFEKKKIQNDRFFKIAVFQNRKFSKFHGLVLGLVGLIDAKGIDVTQPIGL